MEETFNLIIMKKVFVLWAVLAALGCANAYANEPVYEHVGESKYRVTVGDVAMTIDAAAGGKILSFKCGDVEVISLLPMREAFGSTFWTSPQKEWNWPPVPEYDKMAYTVEEKDGSLVLTSQVSERLKYRVRKEFTTDEKEKAVVVTYSIVNEANEARKVAPWEITRVPNEGGLIFFEAPTESITPADLMTFQSAYGAAWYLSDATEANRKVNADGEGWLAYKNEKLLMVKKFQNLTSSQPAPGEAEIQVYVNRGKTYIELESQGAYTELQPGESLSWIVRWYLMPDSSPVEASESLMQKVREIITQ